MSKMPKAHKLFFLTFIGSCFMQMSHMGLVPAIAFIQTNVFPDRTLTEIQTAQTFLNIMSTVFALLAAFLIAKKVLRKKTIVVIGLFVLGAVGPAAVFLHTQFWHLWLLSVMIGAGLGFFVSTMISIVLDNFNKEDSRMATGAQASVVNIGGIFFSFVGGALAVTVWYSGYLLLSLGIVIAVFAIFTVPGSRKDKACDNGIKKKGAGGVPLDVIYYGVIAFIFFLIYMAIGTNISSHLKGIGGTATAGIATAIQMTGGAIAGLLFSKLSARLKDMIIVVAFIALFAGFTILNLGQSVLAFDFIGVFIAGLSLGMVFPQCIFSSSRYVDASNSSTATSIIGCVAPGIGGFLSPLVLTNLTTALGGDNTTFRYQFIGFLSLAFAVIFFVTTRYRQKRKASAVKIGTGS